MAKKFVQPVLFTSHGQWWEGLFQLLGLTKTVACPYFTIFSAGTGGSIALHPVPVGDEKDGCQILSWHVPDAADFKEALAAAKIPRVDCVECEGISEITFPLGSSGNVTVTAKELPAPTFPGPKVLAKIAAPDATTLQALHALGWSENQEDIPDPSMNPAATATNLRPGNATDAGGRIEVTESEADIVSFGRVRSAITLILADQKKTISDLEEAGIVATQVAAADGAPRWAKVTSPGGETITLV